MSPSSLQHQVLDTVDLRLLQAAFQVRWPSSIAVAICSSLASCSLAASAFFSLKPKTTLGTPISLHVVRQHLQDRLARASWPRRNHPHHFVEHDLRRLHGPGNVLQKFQELDQAWIAIDEHLVGGHVAQQVEKFAALRALPEGLELAPARSWGSRQLGVVHASTPFARVGNCIILDQALLWATASTSSRPCMRLE